MDEKEHMIVLHNGRDALLDRTLFVVGPEAFDAFRARLDEPPHPNDKLRRALQTPAPWERHELAMRKP